MISRIDFSEWQSSAIQKSKPVSRTEIHQNGYQTLKKTSFQNFENIPEINAFSSYQCREVLLKCNLFKPGEIVRQWPCPSIPEKLQTVYI